MKPIVRIENWRVIKLRGKPRLYGDVCGHPRTGDEKSVVTSHILEIDEGLSKAETRNTIYLLGAKAQPTASPTDAVATQEAGTCGGEIAWNQPHVLSPRAR